MLERDPLAVLVMFDAESEVSSLEWSDVSRGPRSGEPNRTNEEL
jgi:hypothetical protein